MTEREELVEVLARQREVVDRKLRSCDDRALRASTTPGGLNAHGIVKHLTVAERYWFRHVLAGEPGLELPPDAEEFVTDEPVSALLDAYAEEWARCDAVAGARALDDVAVRESEHFPGPRTLRWVYLHLIEETARHAGHLDLLREQADGAVGYVLDDAG